MIEKNGKPWVCVNFRDLNIDAPKDIYVKPIANMLVGYTTNNELLSFIYDFSSYNQILVAVEDIPKTAFRCPSFKWTFE